MATWTLYYNPKCGTCRNTLELLKKKKVEPRIVEYLKTPPTAAELREVAMKLGDKWTEMVRAKEPVYAKLGLAEKMKSRDAVLKAIAENPILLQRPIVVRDNKAVVARPPEKAEELF